MSFAIFEALRKKRVAGSRAQFESPLDASPEDLFGEDSSASQLGFVGHTPASRDAQDESSARVEFPMVLDARMAASVSGMVGSSGHVEDNPSSTVPVTALASQLVVAFSAGVPTQARVAAVRACGGEIKSTLSSADGDLVVVTLNEGIAASVAIEALQQSGLVRFAEIDQAIGVEAISNDSYYASGSLWGMYGDQTSSINQYGSQAGEAWAMGYTGSSKFVVGVVDTGIDYTHADLYLNVWLNQAELPTSMALVDADGDGLITFRDLNNSRNASFVSDLNSNGRIDAGDLLNDGRWENGIDEDGNNYRDDLVGWDFANNDNDPYDGDGHGTHVSGTIAGMGGNGTGVAGVSWNAQIVALKFLSDSGVGSTSAAILALDYYTAAAVADAERGWTSEFIGTNNSWGGGSYSAALLDAIVRGAKQDLLFVAAAGNGGSDSVGDNNDLSANYPSNYSTLAGAGYEAVIAVAALTSTGGLASYSNYGATAVDIAAPGSGIISSVNGGGYASYSGTSMATPHVSGALALYASANPTMSASQLRSALLTSAAATDSLVNKVAVGGRLNVSAMFGAPEPDRGGDDIIVGFTAGAVIDGGAGTDTLVLKTQAQATAVSGAADAAIINIEQIDASGAGSGVTLNLSAQSEGFTITGSVYVDTITGSSADDMIVGFSASDKINGKAGIDTLVLRSQVQATALGSANDAAIIDVQQIDLSGAGAGISLNLSAQSDGFTITGSAYADTITGSLGADAVHGGTGADVINGFTSIDTVDGGAGADKLVLKTQLQATALNGADDAAVLNVEQIDLSGASSSISVDLSSQSDGFTVSGSAYADIIAGSSDDDIIIGFTTGDRIDGRAGTDSLVMKTQIQATALAGAVDVSIQNVERIDMSAASSGTTLNLSGQSDGFVIIGSAYADTITGSLGADTIDAGAGNDIFNGFTSGDLIDGRAGTDKLVLKSLAHATAVSSAADAALLNVEQIDMSGASTGVVLDLSAQSDAFTVTGSAYADTISGGSVDDVIVGFTAGAVIDGGAGTDTLVLKTQAQATAVSGAADAAIINIEQIDASGAGSGVTLNLSAQSEGFTITGSVYVDTITGSSADDMIVGFSASDKINGKAGIDTLVLRSQVQATALGSANDAAIIDVQQIDLSGAGAGISLNLSAQSDGFTITGSAYADTITGSLGADAVHGGTGADVINGFTSIDTVDGGAGADKLVLKTQLQATALNGADDAAVLNVEQIDLSGASSSISVDLSSQSDGFTVSGSAYADIIAGSSDDDIIIGFTTGDRIDGRAGTDSLVMKTQIQATALAGAVDVSIQNVERIDMSAASSGTTLNLSGQSDGFVIIGSAYADTITGSLGADTIDAGAGNDIFNGFTSGDLIDGRAGTDKLVLKSLAHATAVSSAADAALLNVEQIDMSGASTGVVLDLSAQSDAFTVTGSAYADTISGGSGREILNGGAGADFLTGGYGNDVFVYTRLSESLLTHFDVINDFVAGDQFWLGHSVTSSGFKTTSIFATGSVGADIAAALTTTNFLSLGVTLVTLTGEASDAGTYLAINDGIAGFQSGRDAVVQLAGFSGGISNVSFF